MRPHQEGGSGTEKITDPNGEGAFVKAVYGGSFFKGIFRGIMKKEQRPQAAAPSQLGNDL